MSRFWPNLTTPGKHHTEEKQNQNRKWIDEKKNFFSHHTFGNPFLLLFLILCLLAPPHPNYNSDTHNIDNFLRHRIIVNIFSMKQVMPKPYFTQTLPYFFLISSLKSISTFKIKNLLQNLIYLTLNPSQLFQLQLYPPPLSSHAFK